MIIFVCSNLEECVENDIHKASSRDHIGKAKNKPVFLALSCIH